MMTIGPRRREAIETQLAEKLPAKWGASVELDIEQDRTAFQLRIKRFDGRPKWFQSKGARKWDIETTINKAATFARPY